MTLRLLVLVAVMGACHPANTVIELDVKGEGVVDDLRFSWEKLVVDRRGQVTLPTHLVIDLGTSLSLPQEVKYRVNAYDQGRHVGAATETFTVTRDHAARTIYLTGEGTALDPTQSPLCDAIPDLFAYYPFDSDALDHSGAGADGSATKVIDRQPGVVGGAYGFVSDDGSVVMLSSGEPRVPRSACAWINPSTYVQSAMSIFSFSVASASISTQSLRYLGRGNCQVTEPGTLLYDYANVTQLPCTPGAISPTRWDGSWHFVCFSYDGSTARTYIDGVESSTQLSVPDQPAGTLVVGQVTSPDINSRSFDGLIDEVSIWSRVLTKDEMDQLRQTRCRLR